MGRPNGLATMRLSFPISFWDLLLHFLLGTNHSPCCTSGTCDGLVVAIAQERRVEREKAEAASPSLISPWGRLYNFPFQVLFQMMKECIQVTRISCRPGQILNYRHLRRVPKPLCRLYLQPPESETSKKQGLHLSKVKLALHLTWRLLPT